MSTRNRSLIILLFIINFSSFGQEGFYLKNYDWDVKSKDFKLTEEELEKDQITLFEKKSNHFFVLDENFVNGVLEHKIIRLNNDKAIENNNKFYVSNYGSLNVYLQKARVIKPNGSITELSSKDVKVAYDEYGDPQYQYFAFEGIEVGSIIEYLHIMTFPVDFSGREVKVQAYYDKNNVEYELVCPNHLEFKVKSVNGLPDFKNDTTENGDNRYYMHVDKLEGLEDEPSSAYNANLKKYYYMLSKNLASGKSNFYNYQDITKNVYKIMFAPLESKELKGLNKLIKSCEFPSNSDLKEKMFLLENYLKSNFVVQETSFEGSFDILSILKSKMCSESGLTKIMLNCLRILEVDFELVMTCDRFDNKFVSDFQGYNFLDEYLIYVKELDGYFMSNLFSKFGFPPTEYIFTEGLFIKEINLNGLVSSIGKIKMIEGPDMNKSIDEMLVDVQVDEDKLNVLIDIKRTSTGYKSYYQSFIDYVSDDQRIEFQKEYLNYIDDQTIPTEMKFLNDSSRYYGYKPFIGEGKLKSPNFIEQAGDKLLFKVGMLIGPQSDLYNSKERKLPVETQHLRKYNRTIKFTIPQGYTVKNLDDLNLNITPDFDNKAMGFISSYKLENNILTINISEWYNCISVPVDSYKSYEDVVNGAANFNKIKLVLDKN